MKITPEPRVDDYFMAPADDLLRHYIRQRRDQTGGLTDERFIRLGITRALEGVMQKGSNPNVCGCRAAGEKVW